MTGEGKRGKILWPTAHSRAWLARFVGRDDVAFALEGCAGWRYVADKMDVAGIAAHVGEPADTAGRARAFTPGMRPGPSGNVQLWIATSDSPVVTSEAVSAPAAPACRKVTKRGGFVLAFDHRKQRNRGAIQARATITSRKPPSHGHLIEVGQTTARPGPRVARLVSVAAGRPANDDRRRESEHRTCRWVRDMIRRFPRTAPGPPGRSVRRHERASS